MVFSEIEKCRDTLGSEIVLLEVDARPDCETSPSDGSVDTGIASLKIYRLCYNNKCSNEHIRKYNS